MEKKVLTFVVELAEEDAAWAWLFESNRRRILEQDGKEINGVTVLDMNEGNDVARAVKLETERNQLVDRVEKLEGECEGLTDQVDQLESDVSDETEGIKALQANLAERDRLIQMLLNKVNQVTAAHRNPYGEVSDTILDELNNRQIEVEEAFREISSRTEKS